ncbi:MAG TPA: radical SAM protein [Phycisphaerae bacterium]|nr:radical SAM protein [Phycisphaerae bacterium]
MWISVDDLLFGFRPARWVWKPLIKRAVTGGWATPPMRPADVTFPAQLKRLGLYLHVPFCHNLCPYCPYNRIKYDEALFGRYEAAVHQEIDLVARRMDEAFRGRDEPRPRIVSLYIGGGTPTVVPEGLARLVTHLQEAFGAAGDICVELHPAAMDDACLDVLKGVGVTMLSIGVESLSDRLLELIGRSHDAATAEDAVRRAVALGFDAVNVDLMFALPGQTLDELDHDLQRVLALGVDQISTYPIFGFPYTELGHELGIKSIRRPRGGLIRKMLDLIRRRACEQGFEQCAVWSFLRPRQKKFSSITRHHYLGFGPSAASMTGEAFYVNTFSVEEYAQALPDRLPVALVMPVDRRLEMAYWLYWRAYEMKIPGDAFRELFDGELDAAYGRLMRLLGRLGMVDRQNGSYLLTEQAAYWIHRLQNEYSLNYINRLWGRCREEAWPREVQL